MTSRPDEDIIEGGIQEAWATTSDVVGLVSWSSTQISRLLGEVGYPDSHLFTNLWDTRSEHVFVTYPLGPNTRACMRVQYFRSTQRSPDDDKWYVSVDLVNYYETPPRKISLLDFLDTGLEKIRIQVDPSPQTYAYYYALWDNLAHSGGIVMPVPESSLGWLGTLLHELGHAYSDQNKENAMVSARKFNGYMEILERNEEKLQQNSFDIVLNQKNEFIGAWRVVLGVCREKGTIPQNEADMIESVLESISDGAQYVWDNWGSLKKIYFGSDSVSNAWDYLLCRRHGPKGKYLFKKLGNIVNAVSERSATAYALHAIRRIDRELGTDISHAVFRSTKRYGKVLEGTVHAYLSEALSTYGAHRGEGGIAPGTPLPRFSDFDVPPPKRG